MFGKNILVHVEISMGYIHCCGTLHRTRTFKLVPQKGYLICEVDVLTKCPLCGHKVVQLSKITAGGEVFTVRKTNQKAISFFQRLKKSILYEIRPYQYMKNGKFYLNYNEYGVIKRCYSNLSNLKLGKTESIDVKNKDLKKINN